MSKDRKYLIIGLIVLLVFVIIFAGISLSKARGKKTEPLKTRQPFAHVNPKNNNNNAEMIPDEKPSSPSAEKLGVHFSDNAEMIESFDFEEEKSSNDSTSQGNSSFEYL